MKESKYKSYDLPLFLDVTCTQVGAHGKEQRRSKEDPVMGEYKRVYNRLKTGKNRGQLSPDDWNRQVAVIQELKEKAQRGEMNLKKLQEELVEVHGVAAVVGNGDGDGVHLVSHKAGAKVHIAGADGNAILAFGLAGGEGTGITAGAAAAGGGLSFHQCELGQELDHSFHRCIVKKNIEVILIRLIVPACGDGVLNGHIGAVPRLDGDGGQIVDKAVGHARKGFGGQSLGAGVLNGDDKTAALGLFRPIIGDISQVNDFLAGSVTPAVAVRAIAVPRRQSGNGQQAKTQGQGQKGG